MSYVVEVEAHFLALPVLVLHDLDEPRRFDRRLERPADALTGETKRNLLFVGQFGIAKNGPAEETGRQFLLPSGDQAG